MTRSVSLRAERSNPEVEQGVCFVARFLAMTYRELLLDYQILAAFRGVLILDEN
jgi:hypothetical protein